MLQATAPQIEVGVNIQQESGSQSSPVKRGNAMVTIDKEGRQTVVETGFTFPVQVDFSEGGNLPNGRFVPRYLGWMKNSGDVYDSHKMLYIKAVNAPVDYEEDYGYVSRWLKRNKHLK